MSQWPLKSLDELGVVNRGKSKHRPRDAAHLYGGPYPFIQTGDVKHAPLYITSYKQTYSEAGLEQSRLWEPGTLCITIAANIADTAILKISACFPDSVIGFVPNKEKADARFVKYFFDAMLKKRFKAFTQGAAQDNLSQGKLLSLKFPVPDVTTQIRIADVLSAYDDLIENNRRRIQLLEEAARLLYKEWFVHLRFPGHEHVKIKNDVPEGWSNCPLGEAFVLQRGFDLPLKKRQTGNTPIYASTGVAGYHNKARVLGPGVVTGRSGSLGHVMFTDEDFWPLNTTLWVKEFIKVDPYYTYFVLESLELQRLNGGSAVPTLNRNDVHPIEILIPDSKVKELFAEKISLNFHMQKNLLIMNNKLAEARDLLLPKLMSGELAV